MPWCPECKYEYEPHVVVCPDCGSELIEMQTPVDPQPHVFLVLEYAAVLLSPALLFLLLSPLFGKVALALNCLIGYGHDVAGLLVLGAAMAYGRFRGIDRDEDTAKQALIAAAAVIVLVAFIYTLVVRDPSYHTIVWRIVMLFYWGASCGLVHICIRIGLFLRARKCQ